MNLLSCKKLLLASAMVFAAGNARADGVDLARVLHGPATAGHVIDLMLRYGVNGDCATPNHVSAHRSPHGSMWIPTNEFGDLQLVEIAQLPSTDPACAPMFAVVIQNNSTRDVCGFRVSLVALFGRILHSSPTAIVKVDKVCAGQAVEVHIQMPIEALAMGSLHGNPCEFQQVVVAIDSFDQFVEVNEANNIKLLNRTAIVTRAVVETTTETVESTSTAVVEQATVGTTGQAETITSTETVQTETTPQTPPATDDLKSAIDKLDMDGLDSSGNQTTATRLAS